MALVQKRLAQVSLAKQSAKGTPAGAGTYQIGVTGGTVAGAQVTDQEIPFTWSGRDVEAFDRISVIPGAAFDTVAMPKTIGALLYAACGADTVTGAGDPYSHAIKSAADLPYYTLFSTMGTEFYQIADAKLNSLELTFDRSGALMVKTDWMGTDLTYPGSYTPGADERPGAGVLKGAGGVFKLGGTTAVIKQGTIKIENKLEAVVGAASVEPVDVFPGEHTLSLSLTVIPSDMTLFRTVVTGTSNGAATAVTGYDSTIELKWLHEGSSPAHSLDLLVNSAKYACAFPAADPNGGAQEIVLEATAHVKADGTTPYVFTLLNGVASY